MNDGSEHPLNTSGLKKTNKKRKAQIKLTLTLASSIFESLNICINKGIISIKLPNIRKGFSFLQDQLTTFSTKVINEANFQEVHSNFSICPLVCLECSRWFILFEIKFSSSFLLNPFINKIKYSMMETLNEYYPLCDQQLKHIKIYNSGFTKQKCVNMTVSVGLMFHDISEYLIGRLFTSIGRLRIFNGEGIELFEEDMRFLRDLQILYASPNGEDFDSVGSFKEYKIIQVLGEGGFGKVLLGIHKLTHEKVAIKILNTSAIACAEDIDVVFREAQVLQTLNHKNIVKIFKCYTLTNMKVVFVMEYLEGGELLHYLEEKKYLQEDEVKIYIKQIADAINYCHNQKLIHRDLKLENVLLKSQNQKEIKIVDFGISGTSHSVENINAGSLMYMSPEVLSGKIQKIGPSIDIWAIGVMMYALLCGTLPFQGETQNDIIQSILKSSPTYTENLSSLCRHLLQKIFIADPTKRIKLIDIIKHPWLMNCIIEEQFQEKETFTGRDSVQRKNSQNTISSADLIRLYGGVTNLRNSSLSKSKLLIPKKNNNNLSPLKESSDIKKTLITTLHKVNEKDEDGILLDYSRPTLKLKVPNTILSIQSNKYFKSIHQSNKRDISESSNDQNSFNNQDSFSNQDNSNNTNKVHLQKNKKYQKPHQPIITKRYSKVLEVYKVMDKLSKSLSPRPNLLPNYPDPIVKKEKSTGNLFPSIQKPTTPYLKFNQKLPTKAPQVEENIYFFGKISTKY